jgi:hypothetical protein
MKLNELHSLAIVINQLKMIISSGGRAYSKEEYRQLNAQLAAFERKFVTNVLTVDDTDFEYCWKKEITSSNSSVLVPQVTNTVSTVSVPEATGNTVEVGSSSVGIERLESSVPEKLASEIESEVKVRGEGEVLLEKRIAEEKAKLAKTGKKNKSTKVQKA